MDKGWVNFNSKLIMGFDSKINKGNPHNESIELQKAVGKSAIYIYIKAAIRLHVYNDVVIIVDGITVVELGL